MSAYIIVDLTPVDTEKLQQYSAAASETLMPYGGEFIVKGPIEALHGDSEYKNKVIIAFPNREKASDWYHSDAYQALIDVRDEAMNSKFHLVG